MIIILLGMLMLAGLAIALVLRAAALPQLEAAQRLGTVHAYGYAPTQRVGNDAEDVISGLDGFAHVVGSFMSRPGVYDSVFLGGNPPFQPMVSVANGVADDPGAGLSLADRLSRRVTATIATPNSRATRSAAIR